MAASSTAASRCFMFMYFLVPHWVPAIWRSRAQTSMRAELPSGKLPSTTGTATDLPVQPFNNIANTNMKPVFTGIIAVNQCSRNAILHSFCSLFQLHRAQLLHLAFGLFTFSSLALLGMDCLEYLGNQVYIGTRNYRKYAAIKAGCMPLVFGLRKNCSHYL